jgi:2-methylcitrate dehydratase PrpD
MNAPVAALPPLAIPADFSLKLCETIRQWRYEDLPAPVVRMVKRFLLDTLGVIGGAAHAPGIQELNARLSRWESSGSATGLVGAHRYSPPSAALANGAAAHALDFDDMHDDGRIHTNCVVLPTLLATAQDIGKVSGREFLLAMAIGTELHARFGLACYNSMSKGWHPTMVLGTLSGGMAAARMLGLDARGINHALGMSFHQASGSAQSMRDGVLSKRLGAGFAARSAVMGAFLAADGLTSTPETLGGGAGLFSLYERNEVRPELITDGLGHDWQILQYSFKPYPCCRCKHAAIDLGIQLHREGLRPADVESVEIRMGELNWMTVGAPYEAARDSVVHAQFNVAYGFARALTDGKVVLESYQRPAIQQPDVVALAQRTRAVCDEAIGRTEIAPVVISLALRDGRRLSVRKDTMKGSPQEPMTDGELLEKFRGCMAYGQGGRVPEALADTILSLEHEADAAAAMVAAFAGPA